jgi:hypothetical protein
VKLNKSIHPLLAAGEKHAWMVNGIRITHFVQSLDNVARRDCHNTSRHGECLLRNFVFPMPVNPRGPRPRLTGLAYAGQVQPRGPSDLFVY